MTHFNVNSSKLSTVAAQKLVSCGYDQSNIEKLPYYSAQSPEIAKLLSHRSNGEGLVIPYRDFQGQPYMMENGQEFVRVRMFYTPAQIEVYKTAHKGKEPRKYDSPTKGGSHLFISPLIEDAPEKARDVNTPIIITEGEFKCDVLAQSGLFPIGLSGVWNWVSKIREDKDGADSEQVEDDGSIVRTPIADFKAIKWNHRKVYICFDSDIVDPEKPQIRGAALELAQYLGTLGAYVMLIVLPTELDGGKNGADDFIHRYGVDAFKSFLHFAKPAIKVVGKGKNAREILNPDEPDNDRKAEIVAWILSRDYAHRDNFATFRFENTHWVELGKADYESTVINAYHRQGWRLNSSGNELFSFRAVERCLRINEAMWSCAKKIPMLNGVLEFNDNGEIIDIQQGVHKADYISRAPVTSYLPDSPDPKLFIAFLMQLFRGDKLAVELIRAWFRLHVTPWNTKGKFKPEKCLALIGTSDTGKSVLLEILLALIGEENVALVGLDKIGDDAKVSQGYGKVAMIDTDATKHCPDPGTFNKVISNEPIPMKYLYRNSFTGRLGTIYTLAANSFPTFAKGAEGMNRRLIVLQISRKPSVVDIDLLDDLRETLPEILAWVYRMPYATALSTVLNADQVPSVKSAVDDRISHHHPMASFLLEKYTTEDPSKQLREIKASDVYTSYQQWAVENGYTPVNRATQKALFRQYGIEPMGKVGGNYKYSLPILDQEWTNRVVGMTKKVYGKFDPDAPIDYLEGLTD